ncbi:MAG: hypothetical protein MEQ84_03795 [Mesorhizobium sp.]|nr:hypothetical protein [Mesorhizobium sp.]
MTTSPVPARQMIWLVLGYVVWAGGFVALYAALSIGCEYGWHLMEFAGGVTVQRAILVVLFLATVAATGAVAWLSRRRWLAARRRAPAVAPARFLEWAAVGSSLTAVVAAIVSLAPALVLTSCY